MLNEILPDFPGHEIPAEHEKTLISILDAVRAEENRRDDTFGLVLIQECMAAIRQIHVSDFDSVLTSMRPLVLEPIIQTAQFEKERKYLLALLVREMTRAQTEMPIRLQIERQLEPVD